MESNLQINYLFALYLIRHRILFIIWVCRRKWMRTDLINNHKMQGKILIIKIILIIEIILTIKIMIISIMMIGGCDRELFYGCFCISFLDIFLSVFLSYTLSHKFYPSLSFTLLPSLFHTHHNVTLRITDSINIITIAISHTLTIPYFYFILI